jgi:tripartite motif-containing protein 71
VISFQATTTGTWKVGLKAVSGAANYTVTVDQGPLAPPKIATYSNQYGFSGPAGNYPYGMAWDATDNTIIAADYWNARVKRFSADGQFLGVVSKTAPKDAPGGICIPYGLASDPDGNVWVADENCSRVVEFDHNGNWIRTIGRGGTPNYGFGCGGGNLNVPTYVIVDPTSRNVYVGDPKCGTVYIYSPTGTYIGEFNWTAANLGMPPKARGLAMDASGNIYVAEYNTKQIVVFDKQGNYLRKFAAPSDMNDVRGMAIDKTNGLIYVVGAYYNRVFEFKTDGTFVRKWSGSGSTLFDSIRYPAADDSGHVWIGDTWGYRIWKFDSTANPLPWSQAAQPPPNGGYNLNMGITVTPDNKLHVIDTYEQRVQAFDLTNTCSAAVNCPGWLFQYGSRAEDILHPEGFAYPRAINYGGGYIWIGDNNNHVLQFNPDGTFVARFGSQGKQPGQFLGGVMGVHYENSSVYTTDATNCRLQVFSPAGALIAYMGACGGAVGQMANPRGLTVNGNLAYVADYANNRVVVWDTSTKTMVRTISATCAGVHLSGPQDVALDPGRTHLYIADTLNGRVVRTALDGSNCEVATAGSDTPGGKLGQPRYLAFAPDGRLLVSTSNRRVYAFRITG